MNKKLYWALGGVVFVFGVHAWMWKGWAGVPVSTTDVQPGFNSVWEDHPPIACIINIITLAALYYGVYVVAAFLDPATTDREVFGHIVFWTMAPPLYFGLEWGWLFPEFGVKEPGLHKLAFESLKTGHEVTKDFWAGFALLFLALYTERKDRKKRKNL